MSLENRSSSAMFKRAEQLKRWEESETNLQEVEPKLASRKIKFPLGCVFLAACAAGDKEEVLRLLRDGADIDTANVDGLTALHQACIDDNLDMVEFLVAHGADVNRGDNEGWTPLHATASCGFVSIAKYLIENGADVAAVNNDGELPLDITESDAMDDFLQEIIDTQGIDCKEARKREELMMIEDAKEWLNGGGDSVDPLEPHPKTGATALHVAAAKGYIKVMKILLQGQANIEVQDNDGWTPLHAAAHWSQKKAAELLVENFCNMDVKNFVGQTALDVADSEMVAVLEDLRIKQAALQKDRPPPNNMNNKALSSPKRRSSITRMSGTDKIHLFNKDASSERQILDRTLSEEPSNKVKKVELEIEGESEKEDVSISTEDSQLEDEEIWSEESTESESDSDLALSEQERKNQVNKEEQPRIPSLPDLNKTSLSTQTSVEEPPCSPAWRRPGSFRNTNSRELIPPKTLTLNIKKKEPSINQQNSNNDVVLRRTHSFEADEKFYRRYLELQARIASSCPALHPPSGLSPAVCLPMRSSSLKERRASRRAVKEETRHTIDTVISSTGTSSITASTPTTPTTTTSRNISSPTPSGQQSIGSGILKLEMPVPASTSSLPTTPSTPTTPGGSKLSPGNIFKNFFKSFVPPVRDEESETQRKAHAKRVRETRRSTQGVTLEEIKSAEQLVKKKNQQANSNNDQTITSTISATATITAEPATTIPSGRDDETSHERRPSWRLRVDNNNKFLLEDARNKTTSSTTDTSSSYVRKPPIANNTNALMAANSISPESSNEATVTVPLRRQTKSDDKEDKENDSRSAVATQAVIQRRRKPKRRSTGVVHVDMDEIDPEKQDTGGAGDPESIMSNNERRRTTEIPIIRSNARPRSNGYFSSSSYSIAPGYNSGFTGNSYGLGYSIGSYGGSNFHPSGYSSYGGAYSTYGGTSSGYGSLHFPSSSLSSTPSSSSYKSSSPSSSFKHSIPSNYSKLSGNRSGRLSLTCSGLSSRSSSASSLAGLSTKTEGSEGYGSEDEFEKSVRLHSASCSASGDNDSLKSTYGSEATENGEIDYKKLYEESQAQNERLKEKLKKTEDELLDARNNIEKNVHTNKSSLSEMEKRERRALERKLSEMEEELKLLETLKSENQRLKDENGALIRVISKLSK